jgi:glycosyltransferase involved in cell wall biosynthesis
MTDPTNDISNPQATQIPAKYLVSVIITTRNRSEYVREAISSVLAIKSQKFDLEVIVVDDGSTDATPEVVRQYNVVYLRTNGVGMANARNIGLRAARGDFVTLLDDDDIWLPNNIGAQLELFEQHPEYGAVHAQSQLVNYDKTPFGDPVPAGPLASGWIFEELLTYWPQVGTIVTRTAVAREVGDLDPTLSGDTDWDWLLRVARRHPIGRVEQPVLLFRQRGTAEEELSWRRFPAMVRIFHRHTKSLGVVKRLKLRPILWRHRGWWAGNFLDYARLNYAAGEYKRAYRSLYYAFRCSPPHTLIGCLRAWPLQTTKAQPVSN